MLTTVKALKAEIRDLRRAMREAGIKRISCFNGGLDATTYRMNARMFDLETRLKDAIKQSEDRAVSEGVATFRAFLRRSR